MMKIKAISFLQLIVLFIILTLNVVVLICNLDNKVDPCKETDTQFMMERMYVEDNIRESVLNNNLSINLEAISDKPILVCCYSSQSCGGCVDFAIDKVKGKFVDFETNGQVLFLASGFNDKKNFKEKNTINAGRKKVGLEIDNSMYVCYFINRRGSSCVYSREKLF